MGKILTKNDKEIIDFFNRIQDLKEILKSLKTYQLRSLQNEQYITDSELAEKLNIAQTTLSGYETNYSNPRFEIIEEFANNCDYEIIFRNKKTKEEITTKSIKRKDV